MIFFLIKVIWCWIVVKMQDGHPPTPTPPAPRWNLGNSGHVFFSEFSLSPEEMFRVCIASTIMSKIILIVNSTIKHPCSVSIPILPARVVHVWHTSFTPVFYGENFLRVIWLPKLLRASQLFFHFLTKRDEPFTWTTKRWFGHLNAMVGSSSQPGERFSI